LQRVTWQQIGYWEWSGIGSDELGMTRPMADYSEQNDFPQTQNGVRGFHQGMRQKDHRSARSDFLSMLYGRWMK